MVYAGFWKRFAAAWIDYLVIYAVTAICGILYAISYVVPLVVNARARD